MASNKRQICLWPLIFVANLCAPCDDKESSALLQSCSSPPIAASCRRQGPSRATTDVSLIPKWQLPHSLILASCGTAAVVSPSAAAALAPGRRHGTSSRPPVKISDGGGGGGSYDGRRGGIGERADSGNVLVNNHRRAEVGGWWW